jgi:hypothetical protein
MSRVQTIGGPRSARVVRTVQGGAAIVSAALLLAACSSSTSGKAVGAPAGAAKSGASSTAGSAAGSAPASSAGSSSKAPKVSGNPGSGFCNDARAEQAQEAKQADAFSTYTPAELEKFEEQAAKELPVFAAEAPSAIKSDVQTLVAADQKIFDALKAVNWDFSKLDLTTFSAQVDTPAFTTAADNVTSYLEKVCGISEGDSATP